MVSSWAIPPRLASSNATMNGKCSSFLADDNLDDMKNVLSDAEWNAVTGSSDDAKSK